jgi:hypothetical protein
MKNLMEERKRVGRRRLTQGWGGDIERYFLLLLNIREWKRLAETGISGDELLKTSGLDAGSRCTGEAKEVIETPKQNYVHCLLPSIKHYGIAI